MLAHTIYGGDKSQWLVAFYGFGQSASAYKPLYELIKETHNVLVIDLPAQDYTDDFYPEDFKQEFLNILENNDIVCFSSVSYSMGSRLNLFLPQYVPEKVLKMVLIAPDGIRINFWNRIAVRTKIGHSLFKFFVRSEHVYLNLLYVLYKVRILNKPLYTFSKWNMRDHTQRKKVYNAWMNMRFMVPRLEQVNKRIQNHQIKLVTYFGKQDAVIPLHIYKKCKRILSSGSHNLVDTDHNMLNGIFFQTIVNELRK